MGNNLRLIGYYHQPKRLLKYRFATCTAFVIEHTFVSPTGALQTDTRSNTLNINNNNLSMDDLIIIDHKLHSIWGLKWN